MFQKFLSGFSRSGSSHPTQQNWTNSSQQFVKHVRQVSGLNEQDVFSNLRVPNQFQTNKDQISLVIITGHGLFCIDVKTWSGSVSAHSNTHWHLLSKEEHQNFTHTFIQQLPDALQAITVKANNLCSYLKCQGLDISSSQIFPRILFLSPDCVLSEELRKRKELICYSEVEAFLSSLREKCVYWLTDAFTPSWISGHLSYRQLRGARERLQLMGVCDLLHLCSGKELQGDFQGCHHLTFSRQETEELQFSRGGALFTDSLWAVLGHTPQVTVRMYKRDAQSWLGKPLVGTATIPFNTKVTFRISGEDSDAEIPVNSIHSITLSKNT